MHRRVKRQITAAERDFRRDLGHRLAQARREMHLSQRQVAAQIGVEQQQVSKYEAGVDSPSPFVLLLIARVTNASVVYLLTGETAAPPLAPPPACPLAEFLRQYHPTGSRS